MTAPCLQASAWSSVVCHSQKHLSWNTPLTLCVAWPSSDACSLKVQASPKPRAESSSAEQWRTHDTDGSGGLFPFSVADGCSCQLGLCFAPSSSCPALDSICTVVVSWGDARHLAALAQGTTLDFHKLFINCFIALILNTKVSRLLAGHPQCSPLAAAPVQHWAWGFSFNLKPSSHKSVFPWGCLVIHFLRSHQLA